MSASYKHVLLRGTLDDTCALSKLRGNALVLSKICDIVDDYYKEYIRHTKDAYRILESSPFGDKHVTFPKSCKININMMPIKLFDDRSIPDVCKGYLGIIRACRYYIPFDLCKIAYLTIHESDVCAGNAQRRPGLHVDSAVVSYSDHTRARIVSYNPYDTEYRCLSWGLGSWQNDFPVNGIYVASSVANTTRIWDAIIDRNEGIADKHGGIECLRPYLRNEYGNMLGANQLCWMTDRTPHESVPVAQDTHRQFFRLVVGKIDVWYAQHSTANPLGITPGKDVQILHENKFI